MKFSENWLREWVNPSIDTETLAAKLTMAGLEVDGVSSAAPAFSGVVVAEILSADPHPDADKLRVCQVRLGENPESDDIVQIVCGAPNARPGIRVPLATVGAVLPGDFKIKKAKLRGVQSLGMLCGRDELGIEGDSSGLWELPEAAPVGRDLREYLALDDNLIDVDLTPNRADCLSIRGVARDVGVFCQMDVTEPEVAEVSVQSDRSFSVSIAPQSGCSQYVSRVIEGVNLNAESPDWLKERLARSDIASIHPVVDVTNYVMLELGQPMHAFDLDRLNTSIEVRLANAGESLTLLNDTEVKLDEDVLVIADSHGPLAIAGVMGGLNSAITETSTNVLLESAFFDPTSISGKARRYGLHTDSSHRFERGVDSQLQVSAIERATGLLQSIVGGDAGPISQVTLEEEHPRTHHISLRSARLSALIGFEFPRAEVTDILTRLGLKLISVDDDGWHVETPSWRFDLVIEADLIEEIARIHGYDKLPEHSLSGGQPISSPTGGARKASALRDQLVHRGFSEIVSYSFISPTVQEACFPQASSVVVKNPISDDMSVMRTSLIPGLLTSAAHNIHRQQSDLWLFESGMVFTKVDGELQQTNRIAGLMTGRQQPIGWSNTKQPVDFFDIKREVELLFSEHNNTELTFIADASASVAHPGQSALVMLGERNIGRLMSIHPRVLTKFDINQPVYLFELDEKVLQSNTVPNVEPLSKYPAVNRDLAILVDADIPADSIVNATYECCGSLLSEAIIFDIYQGQGIDSHKKSVGMNLTFRDSSCTLSDELISQQFDTLIAHLAERFQAELR